MRSFEAGSAMAVSILGLVFATAASADVTIGPSPAVMGPGTKVDLGCQLSTSDVIRIHNIKNTTGKTIPAATRIRFSNLHGDTGAIVLSAPLAPNATIQANKPGLTPGGTCTAYFYGGYPDLVIPSASFTQAASPSPVRVVIKNNNLFTPAAASKLRINIYKCQETLVQSRTVDAPAVPAGGSTTIVVPMDKAGGQWIRATANVTNSVKESDTSNNTTAALFGVCIH